MKDGEESISIAPNALPGDRNHALQRNYLRGAAPSSGKLANMVEEDGALQGVELRGVHGDLGEEGIVHENGGLVAVPVVGVAQQGGDIDLEGACEAVER